MHSRATCVSLSGCGFLGMYELGAVDCLQRYWPQLLRKAAVAGASAGAILAAFLVCGAPMDRIKAILLEAASDAQKWSLGPFSSNYNIETYLREGLETLPSDAHVQANDRLFVSITNVTSSYRNVLVSYWDSREELIACLLCSAFIPLFSGVRFPLFCGEKCIDGGFTDNLPTPFKPNVTISPFNGRIDICPNDNLKNPVYVKLANFEVSLTTRNIVRLFHALHPPPVEVLDKLYYEGYSDAYAFLKRQCSINKNVHKS